MALSPLTSADAGAGARAIINAAIAKADQVDGISAALALLQIRLAPYEDLVGGAPDRPGDARTLFTRVMTGSPKARAAIDKGTIEDGGELGQVLRISGADTDPGLGYIDVAPRRAYYMRPGRTYLVQHHFKRAQNPSDPLQHAVELRFQNLSSTFGQVSNVRLGDAYSPMEVDGAYFVDTFIGKAGAPGSPSYIIPQTSAYGVPFFRVYGNGHQTDLGLVRLYDVSDALAGGADIASILARVKKLEDGQAAGVTYALSWDDLKTRVGKVSGAGAQVPDSDTGTHVDPVTGATVSNAAVYSWSVSPPGWRWVSVTVARQAADFVGPGLPSLAAGLAALQAIIIPDADVFDDEGKRVLFIAPGSDGRGAFYITEDGAVVIGRTSFETIDLEDPTIVLAQTDRDYRGLDITRNTGVKSFPAGVDGVVSGGGSASSSRAPQVVPSLKARLTYGQSLATGTSSAPVTETPEFGTLMFAGGIRLEGNLNLTSFVAAIETKDSAKGETGAAASAAMSVRVLGALTGVAYPNQDFDYLVFSGGRGGADLEKLSKGAGFYANMMTLFTLSAPLAAALGRTFALTVIEFIHGQADYAFGRSGLAYGTGLPRLRRDIEADVRAITGQTGVVPMLVTQAACQAAYYMRSESYPSALPTPDIDMAMMDAAAADPNIIVVMSLYCTGDLTHGDGIHRVGEDYEFMGKYRGRAAGKIEKALAEGTPYPEVAVRPISRVIQKRSARIKYSVPFGELTFDETWVLPTFNKGYDVWDVSGTTPVLIPNIISSIAIIGIGKDTVELRFNADLPALYRITYAWGRNESADGGRAFGPRGNLRDEEGNSTLGGSNTYVDGKGVTRRLDNYALLHAFTNKV